MNFKLSNDVTALDDGLEQIWLEINGRNKHNKVLLGVLYQPNFDNVSKIDSFNKMDHIPEKCCVNGKVIL